MSDFGVSILKHYLLDSDRIEPFVTENDKTPVYDGSLFLFKETKKKSENLLGPIPVQIKGEKKTGNNNSSHSIKLIHLDTYRKNGGVLLIKIIYENKDTYEIYARNLLPIDIEKIKSEFKKGSKTISVHLDSLKSLKDLEFLCDIFLDQRKHQMDPDSFLKDLPEDFSGSNRILVNSTLRRNENPLNSFFSKNCYVYLEGEHGNKIPLLINFSEVTQTTNTRVNVKGKYFFKEIKVGRNAQGENYLSFNEILKLHIISNSCDFKFSDDVLVEFEEIQEAFHFMKSVNECGEFSLNDHRFFVKKDSLNENIENDFQTLTQIEKLIKYFRLSKVKTSLKEIDKEFNHLDMISKFIFHEDGGMIKDAPDYFVQEYSILKRSVLLFGYQIGAGKYKVINFLNEFPGTLDLFKTKVKSTEIRCSRFLALKEEHMQFFSQNVQEVEKDLKNKYVTELYSDYQNFALRCIKVYDSSGDGRFLSLAFKMIRFKRNSEFSNEDLQIKLINLLQIKKRIRKLKESEYKIILNLKQNASNQSVFCSCLLLLDSLREFDLEFAKLSEETKHLFKTWPIYELYKEQIFK